MFNPKESSKKKYEFVSIDEMVADDHLLRLIDIYIYSSLQALLTAACQSIKKIATHMVE
jgi:hypothetical protein